MKKSWHQHSQVAPKIERTGHDGFVYDSKTELQRYYHLKLLEKAGEISDIRRQVQFDLSYKLSEFTKLQIMVGKNREKIAQYTADFVYMKTGVRIIEDVKGYRDEQSKFRIRVFEAMHHCAVTIIKKGKGGQWIQE